MRIGRYEVLHRIAVGGMAEIFLARELGLAGFRRLVILKRLVPGLGADIDFVSLFLDEARLAARLAHPNVVLIYELGRDADRYFIAMEYVPGCDLQMLCRALRGALPLPLALFVAAELLEGLHYAHSLADEAGRPLGLVHRDVAPKNVLLSLDGGVKIGDFGVAKARTKAFVTAPGLVMGTCKYMAPEHAKGRVVDRRADVFAAGAVLYRMATGVAPYRLEGERLLAAVRAGEFPHPLLARPDLPRPVVDVLLRAMAREPEARYPAASDMRREVLAAARALGLAGEADALGAFVRATLPELESTIAGWRGSLEPQAAEQEEDEEEEEETVGRGGRTPSREELARSPEQTGTELDLRLPVPDLWQGEGSAETGELTAPALRPGEGTVELTADQLEVVVEEPLEESRPEGRLAREDLAAPPTARLRPLPRLGQDEPAEDTVADPYPTPSRIAAGRLPPQELPDLYQDETEESLEEPTTRVRDPKRRTDGR